MPMIERARYMDALVPDSTSPMDERLVPSWLAREASEDGNWEEVEKKKLETSAQARDFLRSFPAEAFAGVYKIDKSTNQKMVIKSPEDVLDEAYKWLDKKVKGDAKLAREILDASGLIDEIVTFIMSCFGVAVAEEVEQETAKNIGDEDGQPATILREQWDSERTADDVLANAAEDRVENREEPKDPYTHKKASLERTKQIGSYGVMVNEDVVQLWKQGNLVHTLGTEELGGFAVVADEVDSLQSEADVTTLFGVTELVEVNVPTTASLVGKKVVFVTGATKVSGTITAMYGDEGTIQMDDMDNVEVSMPVTQVTIVENDCCVPHLKTSKAKFCPDCGSKLGV